MRDKNRNKGLNESISWVNSRQRMCIRGLEGEYLQLLINRGKEIWDSWVIVSGCRSFPENDGRRFGWRTGHRFSILIGGDRALY